MNSFCTRDHLIVCKARGAISPCRGLPYLLGVAFLSMTIAFVGVEPAVAQSSYSKESPPGHLPERQYEDPSEDRSFTGLPSWAEPSSPDQNRTESSVEKQSSTNSAPAPPSSPSRVPVDGGLALLAAAGAGYAVRKLQKGDDEEE